MTSKQYSPLTCEHLARSRSVETMREPIQELDVIKRDRFELLSAYLDGEVSPDERHLVNTWLSSDPSAKCLYQRLLHLRQGFQTSMPPTARDCEATIQGVFHCLNRRLRLTCMASVGVVVLGILGGLSDAWAPRLGGVAAMVGLPGASSGDLQITLDQPAIAIPKAGAVVTDATVEN